jgi:hypothetical protein
MCKFGSGNCGVSAWFLTVPSSVPTWRFVTVSLSTWKTIVMMKMAEVNNSTFRNYLHYIEKNWIGLPNNKTRADKPDQTRKKPRFEWESWNHHSDLLEGNEITSNQSESYNSSSKVFSSNFICSSVSSSFSGFSSCQAQYLVRLFISDLRRNLLPGSASLALPDPPSWREILEERRRWRRGEKSSASFAAVLTLWVWRTGG